jgi:hypothetical protein
MTLNADRDRLLAIAQELETEADDLEAQANAAMTQDQPPGFSTTMPMQQVQQQQQQAQDPQAATNDDKKDETKR